MHKNPKGYGLGPNLKRLLHQYWDEHGVVPKSESYFGKMLHMEKGVTQGGPVSLTIFNIVVDAVVMAVLLEICGPQEAHQGFVWSAG